MLVDGRIGDTVTLQVLHAVFNSMLFIHHAADDVLLFIFYFSIDWVYIAVSASRLCLLVLRN